MKRGTVDDEFDLASSTQSNELNPPRDSLPMQAIECEQSKVNVGSHPRL